jgi:hypothetical protein
MRFNGANSYINIRINRQGGSLVTITLEKKGVFIMVLPIGVGAAQKSH